MMKEIKFIISVLVFGVLLTILACSIAKTKEENNYYYRSAEVTDIKGTICYLTDTQGNVWCYEDETLQLFARYILVMDNVTTEDITDDVIVEIQ